MKWLVTVVAVVWLLSGEAWAPTIHVYPGDSIQEALDSANPGDLVLVHVEPYGSWTWEEAITLKTGVDLKSVEGSVYTHIDARPVWPPPAAAVDASNKDDLEFGAVAHGFTVKGGTSYGLDLSFCDSVDVADIVVQTDASWAGIYCDGSGQTLRLQDVHLNMSGASPSFGGICLTGCSLVDCSVSNVGNLGIWANGPGQPTFQSVDISYCPMGMYAEDATVDWQGGEVSHCNNVGVDVEAWDWGAGITLNGVTFDDCGTGLTTFAFDFRSVQVGVSNCDFTSSDYGMDLDKAKGFVKSCDFEEIGATALKVTNYRGELDIGYANEGNTFLRVDGTGIELGSGARVGIVDNEFDRVLGTGILCSTGAPDTIDACDLDGFDSLVPEYSYEGIHIEGPGTMVRVRNNDVWDYEDEPSPTPRAVYVRGYYSGTTADLGRNLPLGQWGNNDFRNTGIDVYYTGVVSQGQPIPYLYAQRNYWGGTDPWLAGAWSEYVVWEPTLPGPPGAPPAGQDLSSAPERLALSNACPNPATGRAQFSYGLPAPGTVEVALWDLRGHRVKTLIQEDLPAGTATVEWDGTDEAGNSVASGAYLCRLKSSHGQATRRFVLVR